jgi:hypothetical protein
MWVWGQYVWSKRSSVPLIDPVPKSNLERWMRIVALIICLVVALGVLVATVIWGISAL